MGFLKLQALFPYMVTAVDSNTPPAGDCIARNCGIFFSTHHTNPLKYALFFVSSVTWVQVGVSAGGAALMISD